MLTRIQERPVPAVAGSLAVLAGVALWQLGIEFERAWIRSYNGPLLGETLPGASAAVGEQTHLERSTPALGKRRRWVPKHHPRGFTPERNRASAGNG
jgi:hypothetical protein